MSTVIDTPVTQPPARRYWIDRWEPEDAGFWASTGRRIANKNLWFSILTEHVGFSVWSLWSVLVLFMGPSYGLSPADKFLLVSTPTLVGAVLRLPYTLAVAKFGGRNWTIVSALLLLIPTVLTGFVMHPGTSLSTFLIVAAVAGVGGGNFASSMANINSFFPESRKGWALGLNAGGGNLGVAAVQLIGLLVLSTAGATQPLVMLWIYIPLIVIAAVCSTLFMDNISSVRGDTKAMREVVKDVHCWVMSLLYIGTFGSFIGYGFAFGLVLQNQFKQTPLQAAALTFLGPLLGSVARPLGGWLADRVGGARVTLVNFALMAVGTVVTILASQAKSLPMFVAGFIALFVFSGVGNGSTYKMIPAIFRAKYADLAQARRLSGALIGIAGSIGALGGLFINLAFRSSFANTNSGVPAFISFLAFYAVCFVVTWVVYLRPGARTTV